MPGAFFEILTRSLLPYSLLTLVILSLIFSLPTLIFAIFNHNREVEWLGCIGFVLTVLFHFLALFTTYRDALRARTLDAQAADSALLLPPAPVRYISTAGTVASYTLAGFWLVAFGINTQDVVNGPRAFMFEGVNARWRLSYEIAESVMMGVESVLFMILAVYCTVGRSRARRSMIGTGSGSEGSMSSNAAESKMFELLSL